MDNKESAAFRSDAEWINDYEETMADLMPHDAMNCQAMGVEPAIELLNRRFNVIMQMLLETRKMLAAQKTP